MFREFPVVPKITNDRARDYCEMRKSLVNARHYYIFKNFIYIQGW